MDDTVETIELARALRRYWGKRAQFHQLIEDEGHASVIVYDSSRVTLDRRVGGVRVTTAPVSVPDVPRSDEVVTVDQLPAVFGRVDRQCRAALPSAFLARFDSWVAAGGRTSADPQVSREPGPTITESDLDAQIASFWHSDAAQVAEAQPTTGELRRRVRLYGSVDVVLVRASRTKNCPEESSSATRSKSRTSVRGSPPITPTWTGCCSYWRAWMRG